MNVSRLSKWFVGFLLLFVLAFAVSGNRSGIGPDAGKANENPRSTTRASTVSSVPVDVRDIMEDAQREGPRDLSAK